jgi:hypothetical protein
MFDSHPHIRVALIGLMASSLCGCATNPYQNNLEQSPLRPPIKLLVMESPVSIDSERLQAVLAPDSKPETMASKVLVSDGKKHAQQYALASMEAALEKQAYLEIIHPPENESPYLHGLGEKSLQSPLTQDEANWLHKNTGADALLRFGITDYGLTPRSWRNGYITFEVATTLAIAGVIAFSNVPAAKGVAGAYLAQEAAEETAEAYAGFWGLDEVSRPVRIEAELIQLNPLATLWSDSDTGLSETSWSRLTGKVSFEERNHQLDQSTDDAVGHLASELSVELKSLPH